MRGADAACVGNGGAHKWRHGAPWRASWRSRAVRGVENEQVTGINRQLPAKRMTACYCYLTLAPVKLPVNLLTY